MASATRKDHLEHVRTMCELLAVYDRTINPSKLVFAVHFVDFLGQHVSFEGITPLEESIHSIREFP